MKNPLESGNPVTQKEAEAHALSKGIVHLGSTYGHTPEEACRATDEVWLRNKRSIRRFGKSLLGKAA